MILTGKCKQEFYKWYQTRLSVMTYSELLNINDKTVYNALIIEFFDSVGVYVFPCINFQFGFEIFIDGELENVCIGIDFNTRAEATTEAIKKANEIFNSKNHD